MPRAFLITNRRYDLSPATTDTEDTSNTCENENVAGKYIQGGIIES